MKSFVRLAIADFVLAGGVQLRKLQAQNQKAEDKKPAAANSKQ